METETETEIEIEETRTGRAMSFDKLLGLPISNLLSRPLQFMRTDWGGKGREKGALKKALEIKPEFGVILGKLTAEEQLVLGDAIAAVAEHQVAGCRKRVQPTIDALRIILGVVKPKSKPKSNESLILI